MHIAAIDPGLQGGLAKLDVTGNHIDFQWRPMPVVKVRLGKRAADRGWIDMNKVDSFLDGWIDRIVIEAQAPMPRQSAASTFTLGANFGMLRTLVGIYDPCNLVVVHPITWKSELGIPADKQVATAICREIFGENSPDKDGPAEALLLAFWYWKRRQKHGEQGADAGVLVEPREIRTRIAFQAGHDPSRSGTCGVGYAPPVGRPAGRLFARDDRADGEKDGARRKGSGGRSGAPRLRHSSL